MLKLFLINEIMKKNNGVHMNSISGVRFRVDPSNPASFDQFLDSLDVEVSSEEGRELVLENDSYKFAKIIQYANIIYTKQMSDTELKEAYAPWKQYDKEEFKLALTPTILFPIAMFFGPSKPKKRFSEDQELKVRGIIEWRKGVHSKLQALFEKCEVEWSKESFCERFFTSLPNENPKYCDQLGHVNEDERKLSRLVAERCHQRG